MLRVDWHPHTDILELITPTQTHTPTHWQAALQLNKLTRRLREALKSMQRKMNVKQCKSRLRFELNFASLLTALLGSILRTCASGWLCLCVCVWVSQCANFSIACIIKILRIRSVQLHLLMLHRAALHCTEHWALQSTAKDINLFALADNGAHGTMGTHSSHTSQEPLSIALAIIYDL